MYIKRELLNTIIKFFKRKEYIAITGARQCGKTILFELLKQYLINELKISASNIVLLSFEDRKILKEFSVSPLEFIKSYIKDKKKYFFLDEFQYIKNGGQKLKLIYDSIPDIKIFITGSSSLEIKAQIGKYMVGRVLNFHLNTFNFYEYLLAKDTRLANLYYEKNKLIKNFIYENKKIKIKKGIEQFNESFLFYLNDYLIWGGYPSVVLEEDIKIKNKILNDTLNNYLLKDIKGLLELATEDKLIELASKLSAQLGGIINYNNLSIQTGLDYRNLKKHLRILRETFVVDEVRPFFTNKLKELSKNPKVFFLDPGFRNYLIEDMRNIEKRQDCGSVAENYVFIRLKEIFNDKKINFWRTKAGAEMDFVLHFNENIIPVEVKFSEFKTCNLTKSFISFINTFKSDKGLVITKNYFGILKINETQVLFIPIYYF